MEFDEWMFMNYGIESEDFKKQLSKDGWKNEDINNYMNLLFDTYVDYFVSQYITH